MAGKVRWETACLLANLGPLGAVLWACHLGTGGHRVRTAAVFLLLGTTWSLYGELLFHFCKARARRQREAHVPRNVRLRTPPWIQAGDPIALLAASAPVAALAGGLASGQVGFGVLLAVAAVTATVGSLVGRHVCQSIALEPGGLRLHFGGMQFLVPWKSIAAVDLTGQGEWKMVQLSFLETASALASVEPNTPRARQRAELAFYAGDGSPGRIALDQWAAGIDAPMLARAIKAEIVGSTERSN